MAASIPLFEYKKRKRAENPQLGKRILNIVPDSNI